MVRKISIAFFFLVIFSLIPIIVVSAETSSLTIPHKFSAYEQPSFTSNSVAEFSPQTVTVLENKDQYWYLIKTGKYGNKWVYYNPNDPDTISFNYRFEIYEKPDFNNRLSGYSSQTVDVVAKNENWYQIVTSGHGLVWVYKESLSIPHRFSAYDSPSFESNEVAQFGSQAVTVVQKSGFWNKIVTSNYGEKWVYYNPNDPGTISFDYRFEIYEKPDFNNRLSGYSPQTVDVVAKDKNWYQIVTSGHGLVWVYKESLSIPHRFSAYDSASFKANEVAQFGSQTVTVVQKSGFWNKIVTSNYGEKWVYYNPNDPDTISFDYRFEIYEKPDFSNRLSGYSPQTVDVVAKDKNWYQIVTSGHGLVWVYKESLSIPHRFSAYDSASFESNEVAQFGSQTVTVVQKSGFWNKIITSNYGEKWVYYNPNDPETITFNYKYEVYEKPEFDSTKLGSYATTSLDVSAQDGDWYQVNTSQGLVWVFKQRLDIPHRFSAYETASFKSNEVAQYSPHTVTVVEKRDYWNKIITSKYGEKWVYYNPSLGSKSFTERFEGYKTPDFSNKVSSFSPNTVKITAQYGDWLQFETGSFGNLWVYTGKASESWIVPLDSTNYIVRSEHGYRWINGKWEYHAGIDLAQNGTVRVIAAADGVVTKSKFDDSYGQVVFIKHTVNGQNYEAVYAHMREGSQAVKAGDSVRQGQFIGYMGTTGHSTGQHLHFEIHVGTYHYGVNDRNPRNYISF